MFVLFYLIAYLHNSSLINTFYMICSQFGDIYQEYYFINLLKDDVRIIKELPFHLQSLDLESIGSQVGSLLGWFLYCLFRIFMMIAYLYIRLFFLIIFLFKQISDMDIMKESKPIYLSKFIRPLLLRNGVVHFVGFVNRLAFDPMPSNIQVHVSSLKFTSLLK